MGESLAHGTHANDRHRSTFAHRSDCKTGTDSYLRRERINSTTVATAAGLYPSGMIRSA